MAEVSAKPLLTKQQERVVEGLANRLTIKEVAADLGLSPSTINQHIKAAKLRLQVNTHRELVEAYCANCDSSSSTRAKNGVSPTAFPLPEPGPDDPGGLVLSDSQSFDFELPRPGRDRIVPQALDGTFAGYSRLAAMAVLVAVIFTAVVLGTMAVEKVSDAVQTTEPNLALERS